MQGANFNSIYEKLVEDENDVLGRVAYSLYKQQKVEFIKEFKEEHSREPNTEELKAFNSITNTTSAVENFGIRAHFLIEEFLDLVLDERTKQLDAEFEERMTQLEEEHAEKIQEMLNNTKKGIQELSKASEKKLGLSYFHGIIQNIIATIIIGILVFSSFVLASDISLRDIAKAYLESRPSAAANSVK